MFLGDPPPSEAANAAVASDVEADGYVSNLTRLWCWRPDFYSAFGALPTSLASSSTLTHRDRAVLVTAAAAARNDSYCSLAWGSRLAKLSDDDTAADVIKGLSPPALSEREAALAGWARHVVGDPNGTTADDVADLRAVGFGDVEIFEATALVALRVAFTTINDALGARPDRQLADRAPAAVRAAVSFGRSPSPSPSSS